jgi:hypothetical protein
MVAGKISSVSPDRGKIIMTRDDEVRYWMKHLEISQEELQRLVDKVGNSATAVQKELARQKR